MGNKFDKNMCEKMEEALLNHWFCICKALKLIHQNLLLVDVLKMSKRTEALFSDSLSFLQ